MSLETPFGWGVLVGSQQRAFALLRQPFQRRKVTRGLWTLPLRDGDVVALGHRSQYIQDVLARDAGDPRWQPLDHSRRAASVTAPVSSIGGWYDIFLPGQVRDFRALVAAGKPARLTIGPWTHVSLTNIPFLEAIDFGLAHARGLPPNERAPYGSSSWARKPGGLSTTGRRAATCRNVSIARNAALAVEAPAESRRPYRYDPADRRRPRRSAMPPDAGRVDNAKLEARADVLKYTTGVLERRRVVGEISAEYGFVSCRTPTCSCVVRRRRAWALRQRVRWPGQPDRCDALS